MSVPRYPAPTAGGACLSCGVRTAPGARTVQSSALHGWRICPACNVRTRESLICAAVAARHGEEAAASVRAVNPLRAEVHGIGPRTLRQFADYPTEQATAPVEAWELQAGDVAAILAAAEELLGAAR